MSTVEYVLADPFKGAKKYTRKLEALQKKYDRLMTETMMLRKKAGVGVDVQALKDNLEETFLENVKLKKEVKGLRLTIARMKKKEETNPTEEVAY